MIRTGREFTLVRKSKHICRGFDCPTFLVQRPGESDDSFRHRHLCAGCESERPRHRDVIESDLEAQKPPSNRKLDPNSELGVADFASGGTATLSKGEKRPVPKGGGSTGASPLNLSERATGALEGE